MTKGISLWVRRRCRIGRANVRHFRVGAVTSPYREYSSLPALRKLTRLVGCLLRTVAVLRHRWWSIVTADIPLNCRLGGGLLMPHPNGIVIHPDAEIGRDCLIFQQVTIGTREGGGAPKIGGNVDIGARTANPNRLVEIASGWLSPASRGAMPHSCH
jgi:serine acetyltransferase